MVKCSDCGFLAQHIFRGIIPQGFIDVDETPRETGILPGLPFSIRFISAGEPDLEPEKMDGDRFPTCFRRAFNLKQEVEARQLEKKQTIKPGSLVSGSVRDVIHQDRICNQFVKWERGFTPKEHREMIDREHLLKIEEDRKHNDRKWHWIELGILVVGAGLFTLLGAWITKGH